MTTHVYYYDKRAWEPYVPNIDQYKDYFVAMSEGKVKPGKHIVGVQKGSGLQDQIKLVSPTAQALEMAKEVVKHKKRRHQDTFSNL